MDIGLVRNAKFVEKNKNLDCWRIPSLSVVQSGCGSSVFLLLLFKELKIGLSENSVFNVYHPDAVELYSVCNSLSKVQILLWPIFIIEQELFFEVIIPKSKVVEFVLDY